MGALDRSRHGRGGGSDPRRHPRHVDHLLNLTSLTSLTSLTPSLHPARSRPLSPRPISSQRASHISRKSPETRDNSSRTCPREWLSIILLVLVLVRSRARARTRNRFPPFASSRLCTPD